MSPITAITIKIPKSIPALKIPSTAWQELNIEEIMIKIIEWALFEFFMYKCFKMLIKIVTA